MQNGEQAPLAVRQPIGPCISPRRSAGTSFQIINLHCTIPDGLSPKGFMNRHRLHMTGRAAVLRFHGLLKLIG